MVDPDLSNARTPIDGRLKILLYALTESTTRKVKESLERLYPGVCVATSNDRRGNPRLRNLARTSHIVVVDRRDAKHAATLCIQENRGLDTEIVKFFGQGANAMMNAATEALAAAGVV